MVRKYLVFWSVILIAVASLSIAVLIPRAQEIQVQSQVGEKEGFALELERSYDQIDVVNIRTYVDEDEDINLGLYFDILIPMNQDQVEVLLLDILQGMDTLSDGTENKYVIDYLYGRWQVGRTTCPAQYYSDVQSGLDLCRYEEIQPPEYGGRLVVWEGRGE
jgi:hypothetical protein